MLKRTRTQQRIDWSQDRRLGRLARRKPNVKLVRPGGQTEHEGKLIGVSNTGPNTRMVHLETPTGPIHAGVTTRYQMVID